MELQTILPLDKASKPINYNSKIVLLGSCFVEHIGDKLDYLKFESHLNPVGILFLPISIRTFVSRAVRKELYKKEDLFYWNDRWACFEVHSSLSNASQDQLLANLNDIIKETRRQLKSASHLVITLGTAWGFQLLETGSWVANCHKVPQNKFVKKLMSVEEIRNSLTTMITQIRELNPDVQIIWSVSPVRHLKNGFVENQRSKAHLITAVHQVADNHNSHYFPSYELMMDELRDYRFYDKDMIHPNSLAVEYIWEKFSSSWVAEEAYSLMEEVASIQKALAHKPFEKKSEAHKKFLKALEERILKLQKKYPRIQFNKRKANY